MPPKRSSRSLAAARRMAGKKGGAVALQTEVNNEEDWSLLMEKQGLVVVDVYSEWCGPCLGMVGNLKKLKLEIGSDYLHLAVAKSDAIQVLERFRNKSEPTWMFIGSGKMVHIVFGANAPKLMRTIQAELEKELKVIQGERERVWLPFLEMTDDEKVRAKIVADKLEQERKREEKEIEDKLEELKIKSLTKLAKKLPTHTLCLYFPHTIEGEKKTCTAALKMLHQYDMIQLMIIDQQEVQLTPEDLPELLYNATVVFPEKFKESLSLRPCLVTMLLGIGATSIDSQTSMSSVLGKVEEKLGNVVYGGLDPNNPIFNSPAYNFQSKVEDEVWPGIWTPLNYLSKASAVKILFPSIVRAIGHEDDQLPPPRYVVIFDAARAREVSEVAEEFPGEVLKIGYFDSVDPETAKRVCKNIRDLERMNQEKLRNTKMVISLAKSTSDPLLAFSQLGPIYISPDLKIGTKESELFFPPDQEEFEVDMSIYDDELGEEMDEEGEELEGEFEDEEMEGELEEEEEETLGTPVLSQFSFEKVTEPAVQGEGEEEGDEEEEDENEEEGAPSATTETATAEGEPPPAEAPAGDE